MGSVNGTLTVERRAPWRFFVGCLRDEDVRTRRSTLFLEKNRLLIDLGPSRD
jgi:hypothetical protein